MKSIISILVFSFTFSFIITAQSNFSQVDSKSSIMVLPKQKIEYINIGLPQYREVNWRKSTLRDLVFDIVLHCMLKDHVDETILNENTFSSNNRSFSQKYIDQMINNDPYLIKSNVSEYKMVFGKR